MTGWTYAARAVVDARSYSRNSRVTSHEQVTPMPGKRSEMISATRRSWTGFA